MTAESAQKLTAVFGGDGNLLGFRIEHLADLGEPLGEQYQILSAKEMLPVLKEYYENSSKEKKISVSGMELIYMVTQSGEDEQGRDVFTYTPVWAVNSFKERDAFSLTSFFNAITGELEGVR